MDNFNSDLQRTTKLQQELNSLITERSTLLASKASTGRVDYRIKGGMASLQNEMSQLQKLAYLYESNGAKYANVKDKQKRIQSINVLKTKADATIQQINSQVLNTQTNTNLLDIQQPGKQNDDINLTKNARPQRDLESGEFSHTQN